jgi:hypothetical protein
MIRCRSSLLVHVLVAAQVLLSTPVMDAPAASPAPTAAETHCGDGMPMAPDGENCPCCPEGVVDAASCFSHCLVAPGPVHAISFFARTQVYASPAEAPGIRRQALSDPPIKPPPIV